METPYTTPESNLDNTPETTYQPKIFSVSGRIGRLRYLAYSFFFIWLSQLPLILIVAVAPNNSAASVIGTLAYAGGAIVGSFIAVRRRLHDLNQSSWLSLLILIPLVNVFLGLWLLFAGGSSSTNKYGAAPTKTPVAIIIFALLIPGVAILGILAAIALPAYQAYVEEARNASTLLTPLLSSIS